jgi:hypothetical protein
MVYSKNFKVGDMVMFEPNGLMFRCENIKMWKWMQESGYYVIPMPEFIGEPPWKQVSEEINGVTIVRNKKI